MDSWELLKGKTLFKTKPLSSIPFARKEQMRRLMLPRVLMHESQSLGLPTINSLPFYPSMQMAEGPPKSDDPLISLPPLDTAYSICDRVSFYIHQPDDELLCQG